MGKGWGVGRGAKVAEEAGDEALHFDAMRVERLELLLTDIALVDGDVQVGLHLCCRAQRIMEKSLKFLGRSPVKAFRNIGHDRRGGPLHLIAEPIIPGKGTVSSDGIDQPGQLARLPPRLNLLKPPNTPHLSNLEP